MDRVSFLIAPNPGEGLKPLSKIASGGETARLMLALKSILSEADQTPTLVFDEIDVGVGGRSGQVVGETLWSLTTNHQVIVITHLPQIAAFGDVHFQIAKSERDGRVVSTINALMIPHGSRSWRRCWTACLSRRARCGAPMRCSNAPPPQSRTAIAALGGESRPMHVGILGS